MNLEYGKCIGTILNGDVEIYLLAPDDLEETLQVFRNSFYIYENLSIAADINLRESIEAKIDVDNNIRVLVKDGISLVAKHVPSNRKIIGAVINNIQNKSRATTSDYSAEAKTENFKAIMNCLNKIEKEFDFYKNWNIDCIFEMVMITVLPEFNRLSIGKTLAIYTINLAKKLSQGLENHILPEELKNCQPKAIYSIFTSLYSQNIGSQLGYETIAMIPFTEFLYKERKFSEVIDPIHKYLQLSAQKL